MRRTLCRAILSALVMLLFVAPTHAATGVLDPVVVFEDGTGDGPIGGGVDSYQDLVAGTISEDSQYLTLTFIVDDIPDPLTKGFPLAAYYWDFSIDDSANARGKQSYELSITPPLSPAGSPSASLGQNCTLTGNLWSCDAISASMTLKIDSVADTISVSIKRTSLKDESGKSIAENGAVFEQQQFFAGIAAFTTTPAGLITPGGTGDDASMDDIYVLGQPRE